MHILRSYLAVPPSPGGMERHIHVLSERQRALGCEVTLAFSSGDTGRSTDLRVLAGWPILHSRPQSLRDLLFYCAVALRLLRTRVRCDVVHVHGDWSAFLFGRLIARLARARVRVASMHGHLRRHAGARWLYRAVCSGYDVAYATGRRESRLLTEWTGRTWHWITSGVDDRYFEAVRTESAPRSGTQPRIGAASRDGSADVLTVATLTAVKNLGLLLRVAQLLPHRSFLIVGDGELRDSLAGEARAMNLQNVRFAGALEPAQLPAIYTGSGVFLLTSSEEGTPTVILEAMACGLPIVTTRSNDFTGIVDEGDGGFVVDGFDASALAQRIEQTLADPQRREAMGRHNRAKARAFGWERVSGNVTELMRAALTRAPGVTG